MPAFVDAVIFNSQMVKKLFQVSSFENSFLTAITSNCAKCKGNSIIIRNLKSKLKHACSLSTALLFQLGHFNIHFCLYCKQFPQNITILISLQAL